MSSSVTVTRAFIISLATLMTFGGGLILWQQINQPSTNSCYYFPAGTLSVAFFLQPYQGSCPFDSLPNYYASDIALTLIVTGFLLSLFTVKYSSSGIKATLG